MERYNKKPPIGTRVIIKRPGFEPDEQIIRGRILPKVHYAGRKSHEWDRLETKGETKAAYKEYKRVMNKYAQEGIMFKI